MRGGCLFLGLAVAMTTWGCWGGAQGLYTRVTNLSQREMTCADYVAERPTTSWLKITGCYADVLDSAIETGRYDDDIKRMWIPMFNTAEEPRELAFVYETALPGDIARVQDLGARLDSVGQDDIAGALVALQALRADSVFDADGLIAFGYDLDDEEHAEVAGLVEGAGDDFAVLRAGESPSMMMALLHFVMSFIGMGLLVFIFAPGNDS